MRLPQHEYQCVIAISRFSEGLLLLSTGNKVAREGGAHIEKNQKQKHVGLGYCHAQKQINQETVGLKGEKSPPGFSSSPKPRLILHEPTAVLTYVVHSLCT